MILSVPGGFRLSLAALLAALPMLAGAGTYDLTVETVKIDTGDFVKTGIGYNGSSPGPVLHFKEGEDVTINVTNALSESTSIHWHGVILPFQQDGVPEISFPGIAPGKTFTYRFPITQSGTYWYHSHSKLQEPDGAFGAIVIEPAEREPFRYDRDYVVQFTDKHRHGASRIMRNLKMAPDYYNRQQRTLSDFVADARRNGFGTALAERRAWGEMRMMPTDIEDLQGFVPLINGVGPQGNWTGEFTPGERVRLRFINSSAMTYFDIRIPGLEMTVVQADGQNVQPVKVDELRIAVAETYDVIVRPTEDRPYTIFAESMGRTAYARGTLAPRMGMSAEVPEMRDPPLLTMADMGMAHDMAGMDHGAMQGMDHFGMSGMGGGHKMPDGTMMQGSMQGMEGGHQMPDGTVMENAAPAEDAEMPEGQPMMPDGTVMPMQGHTMPDGTMMNEMNHGTVSESSKSPGDWDAFLAGPAAKVDWNQQPVVLDRSKTKTHTMPDGTVMEGMDHGAMTGGMTHTMPDGTVMEGMAMQPQSSSDPAATMPMDMDAMKAMPGDTMAGMDHSTMPRKVSDPFYADGSGLTPVAAEPGGKVLSYSDLKAQKPLFPDREPTREIELRLTGNMERYAWSINGVKYSDAEPIVLQYGERVRFKFVNETMMSHPMHLHGMWSILDNGNGGWNPAKHTISVAPGTTVYSETEVDAPGQWAFHCHLSYHMMAGMFRKVVVEGGPANQTVGG